MSDKKQNDHKNISKPQRPGVIDDIRGSFDGANKMKPTESNKDRKNPSPKK